ncbi:MAG: polysaccharide pyruvyl transferase family protein, partial [Clostridia bacterium]|nr:polysaccharide pyruvyl transferase family protein [Clostridia bacterium]
MKKIFLCAYDKQNLGDDLFIHTICNRYPKTKFYLWSDKENKENFKRVKNLVVIDEKGPFVCMLKKIRPSFVSKYKYRLQKSSKAMVYIGGSIFMEYTDWRAAIDWWGYWADNFPYYAIGCNWGPYKTEEYLQGMSNVFAKMQDVCFRDKYSYYKFSRVETVRSEPDILFSYPIPQVNVQAKTLFVSPINCIKRGEGDCASLRDFEKDYLDNLAKLLKEYLQNGYTLTLSSFSKKEGDEEAIARLREKMGIAESDIRVKNLFYDGKNHEEILSAIAKSESVIATRFHASILSIVAGRPVLPIVYSDKTLHVLEDIGFTGKVLDLRKG